MQSKERLCNVDAEACSQDKYPPPRIKAKSLISINGETIVPDPHGDGEMSTDSEYPGKKENVIPASALGSFGGSDFVLEMSVQIYSLVQLQGASLFARWARKDPWAEGLAGTIQADGAILFSQLNDGKAMCPSGTIADLTEWHDLVFSRKGNILSIAVDNMVCGSFNATTSRIVLPTAANFVDAPLRIHGHPLGDDPGDTQTFEGSIRSVKLRHQQSDENFALLQEEHGPAAPDDYYDAGEQVMQNDEGGAGGSLLESADDNGQAAGRHVESGMMAFVSRLFAWR
jgi:hypothetical protein